MAMTRTIRGGPACKTPRRMMLAVLAACGPIGAAHAIEFETGNTDLAVRWDNTLRYNYARRIESQDPHLLASPNNDDGNRNFGKGTVSNRLDLLSEFDFVYRKSYGFRVSAAGWADQAYSNLDNTSAASSNHLVGGVPGLGLSDATRRYHKGPSGEFLDAFVFGQADIGGMTLDAKLGRHTMYWGEALLSPIHGLNYGQAPLDLRKMLSVPGTEAKELLLPRNALSAQMVVTPELSVAAQYFLDWKPFRIPETGSYLGGADMLLDGGESLIAGPGARMLRGADITPKKQGDWGAAIRWNPTWLEGGLGLYFRRTADIQPQVHVQAGVTSALPAAKCTALGFTALNATTCYINPSAVTVPDILAGKIGRYYLVYPGDVDILGLSLSKSVAGMSLGAEISYRRNMPLNSDAVTVFSTAAGATPLVASTSGAIAGLPGAGQTGGAVGNTWHGILNLVGTVSGTTMFDAFSWAAELQWSRWDKVTSGQAVFKGRDAYAGVDKVSKDFVGLSLNVTPTWFQVLPGVDLSAPMAVSTGLAGNSAVGSGGNKNAGNYSVGVTADVRQKYRFDLRFVDFFGPYGTNAAGVVTSNSSLNALIKDRGFLSFTFKTTF